MKDREETTLEELFPGPEEQCASGPEGRFVHELIVPFVRTADAIHHPAIEVKAPRRGHSLAPVPRRQRSFPPGSDWLSVKLYTGAATADQVLRVLVGPVVRETMRGRLAERWFFIRYSDPDPHLRLRVHGVAETLQQKIWPSLRAAAEPFLDDGRIWRITLDTYEREIERYGGPDGIEVAERLFHADSEAVLRIVEELDPGDAGLDERWRLTFRGMHDLLEDLQIDLDGRVAMLRGVAHALAKELRFDRKVAHWLGERFRRERASLSALIDPASESEHPLAPGLHALRQRSRQWRPAVAKLKALEAAGRLSASDGELATSYLHMHANRLLRSAQREQEAVLYEFLARHYESEKARTRPSAVVPAAVTGVARGTGG